MLFQLLLRSDVTFLGCDLSDELFGPSLINEPMEYDPLRGRYAPLFRPFFVTIGDIESTPSIFARLGPSLDP